MIKNPKILIIGAGASGLAAATKLYENGLTNFKILEAEDRIGGRIHSVPFGRGLVDLGGQWVHGEDGNLVYDMVKNLDLLSPSFNTYEDMTFYLPEGSVMDKTVTDTLFKIGEELLYDENAKNEPGTFGNFFIKRYNEAVLNHFGNNKDILEAAKLIEEWFNKFFLCLDTAKSWHDISVKGAFAFTICEGDQQLNWKDKGFKTILDVLMKKIPDPQQTIPIEENIILKREVNSIIWENSSSNSSQVTVICTDGSSYSADHVIITVSVGVLKENHRTWFKPKLPPYKVNSIEHVTLGTVNKIFLKFPQKWWPDDVKGFSFIWTEEAKLNLKNEIANIEPVSNGKSWLENVFGFYVIDGHPDVLLGWVTGELTAEVEELSDEIVMTNCMYLLRKFVGVKYDVMEPDGILRSKWYSNPHFRGAYTFCSIEAEQNNASCEDLARPISSNIGKNVLLFAGESTHSTHYSTVHGAIATGYREADRLIDLYKLPDRKEVIIIGAGMAGLGAAWNLKNHGFDDFLILEATDRPGGRVQTIHVDGYTLDLGAQWIHGKYNPLYEIASSNDLLSENQTIEGSGIFVRNDGFVFDDFLVKKVDWEVGKILEKCGDYLDKSSHPKSVKEFLDQEFKKYLENFEVEIKELLLQLYDWHIRFQTIDNSALTLNTVSAKYWGTYVCTDENTYYNLKNGYQPLIDVIVNKISRKHFVYNTPVTSIDLNGSHVSIRTSNEREIICNHVILTSSLGVLKNCKNISSILSNDVKESIEKFEFYGIGKIFLIYNDRWWGELKGIQFLWNCKENLQDDDTWFRHLTGFEPLEKHSNILMGLIGGEGVALIEKMNEQDIGRVCVTQLRRFLPKFNVPEPIKVVRTNWLSNEWTLGSYSNISSSFDNSTLKPDDLARPLYVNEVPRILLAGEAVHSSNYSTTHGAFESGQQQSNILYEFIKSKHDTNLKKNQ